MSKITILTISSAVLMMVWLGHSHAQAGSQILALTNAQRSAAGLSSLGYNRQLATTAAIKAADICTRNYWAHTAPDGTTAWTLMDRIGYPYITAGENLAKGFSGDSATMAGWMASAGHRANILNNTYTEMGSASVQCHSQSTTITVAHYGSRQTVSAPVATKPATSSSAPAVQPKTTVTPTTAPAPATAVPVATKTPTAPAKTTPIVKTTAPKIMVKTPEVSTKKPVSQLMWAALWNFLRPHLNYSGVFS